MKQSILKKICVLAALCCTGNSYLYAISFPYVGSLTLSPEDNEQALIATPQKPLVLGPLTLDQATFSIPTTTFKGHGLFLNNEVSIEGKNFKKDKDGNVIEGTLSLSYAKKPELKILTLPVVLQETVMQLQDNAEPTVMMKATLLGKPISITVQEVAQKSELTASIATINLADFLPSLSASALSSIVLNDVEITIADFLNKPNTVELQSQADASTLLKKKDFVSKKEAAVPALIAMEDGYVEGSFRFGRLRQLSLDSIDNLSLTFTIDQGKISEQLTGSYDLHLPGAQPTKVSLATPFDQKKQSLEGIIHTPLVFSGSKAENTKLQKDSTFIFDIENKNLSITGTSLHFELQGEISPTRFVEKIPGEIKLEKKIKIDQPMLITITRPSGGVVMINAGTEATTLLKLSDIVFDPRMKNALNQVENISLRNVVFNENTVSGLVEIKGTADIAIAMDEEDYGEPFDEVVPAEKKVEKNSASFIFKIKPSGHEFFFDLGDITIPALGTLHKAKLGTKMDTYARGAPPLILEGTINLPIPEIGEVPLTLSTQLKPEVKWLGRLPYLFPRPEIFSGTIQNLTYENFTLTNAKISFEVPSKKFEITSDTVIYNFPVTLSFSWAATAKRLEVSALLHDKELRPFGDTPPLNDIVFSNPKIKFSQSTNQELVLSGTLLLFGEKFSSSLSFITMTDVATAPLQLPGTQGRPTVIVAGETMQEKIKTAIVVARTDIVNPHQIATFKDSVVEAISIEDAKIVVTNKDYQPGRSDYGPIGGIVIKLTEAGKNLFDNYQKTTFDLRKTGIKTDDGKFDLDKLNASYNGSLDEVKENLLFISFAPKIGEYQLKEYQKLVSEGLASLVTLDEHPGIEVEDLRKYETSFQAGNISQAAIDDYRTRRERKWPTSKFLYRKGISLEGYVVLTGYLSPIAAMTKKPSATKIKGLVTLTLPKVKDSQLTIKVSNSVKISDKLSLRNFDFAVDGFAPPKISATVRSEFKPSEKQSPIDFALKGEFLPVPPTFKLSGSAMGTVWNNVFGLENVALSNVGMGIGLLIAWPPVPNAFAIAGDLKIPTKTIGMALSADLPTMQNVGLVGKVSSLSLLELITIGFPPGAILFDFKKAPNVVFKDVKIYIAPKSFSIGDLNFREGIGGEGSLVLFGKKSSVGFKKSSSGYVGSGSMDPLDIGPVHISGATEEQGPEIKFDISNYNQNFIIAGDIRLGSFTKRHGELYLTDEIMSFSFSDYLTLNKKRFGYTLYAYMPRVFVPTLAKPIKLPEKQTSGPAQPRIVPGVGITTPQVTTIQQEEFTELINYTGGPLTPNIESLRDTAPKQIAGAINIYSTKPNDTIAALKALNLKPEDLATVFNNLDEGQLAAAGTILLQAKPEELATIFNNLNADRVPKAFPLLSQKNPDDLSTIIEQLDATTRSTAISQLSDKDFTNLTSRLAAYPNALSLVTQIRAVTKPKEKVKGVVIPGMEERPPVVVHGEPVYVPEQRVYVPTEPAQPTAKERLQKAGGTIMTSAPWAAFEILKLDFRVKISFENTLGVYLIDQIALQLEKLRTSVNNALNNAEQGLQKQIDAKKAPGVNTFFLDTLQVAQNFLNTVLGVGKKIEKRNIKFLGATFEGSANDLLTGIIPYLDISVSIGGKVFTHRVKNIFNLKNELAGGIKEDVEEDIGLKQFEEDLALSLNAPHK